jgi:hypothetical protein
LKLSNFINILENKATIGQVETAELKAMIDKFPYFQSARVLHLKGLKDQDSFKYNKELKKTAAYTTDRTILFEFITSKEFNNSKEKIPTAIIKNISEQEEVNRVVDKKTKIIIPPVEEIELALEVGKPIAFQNSENYSFNQWLQLSTKKPIQRKLYSEVLEDKIDKKIGIIEAFIQNNPKIKPLTKDKNISISVAKNKQDSSLMTETLAKVYLEQKKYENAMQAYRILILKYPEKSGFFADQIKRIQILQKNKS